MSEDISFEYCGNSRGDTMNIFIHGYSAAFSGKEKSELKNKIAAFETVDTNVFAFWPSGSIYSNILNFNGAQHLLKFNPYLLLAAIAINQIDGFKKIENDIKHIKYQFYFSLKKFLHENRGGHKNVNIYSHSLGARLIIESIIDIEKEYDDIGINHLIFMAGARNLNEIECEKILNVISGSIYNIHSSNDFVLKIKPDFEKCIGVHPIQMSGVLSDRVKNISFNSLGHTDYWEGIQSIIKYLDFNNLASKELMIGKDNTFKLFNSFPTADDIIYNVIYFATVQERNIIALLLNKRNKNFLKEELDPTVLTNEIQLMGGDSFINKWRGHGVKYSEIINDLANHLEIKGCKKYGSIEMEGVIVEVILNDFKKQCLINIDDCVMYEDIINVICRSPLNGKYSSDDINIFLDVYKLMDKLSFRSIHLTGPAYQVLIPIVIMIKIIRSRISGDCSLSKYVTNMKICHDD